MNNNQDGLKPFVTLILSTKIPKLALSIGLAASLITTLAGLLVPVLTKNLVDGFSVSSLSVPLIIGIGAAFIFQAIISGVSIYLLSFVGQKIVARLRERMWVKLIRLPVSYFDKQSSGETVSRIVNDTSVVRDLISNHFPQFIIGDYFHHWCHYHSPDYGLENDFINVNICSTYLIYYDAAWKKDGENLAWFTR